MKKETLRQILDMAKDEKTAAEVIEMIKNYEEKYEYSRGAEIDGWLKEHPEVTNYVIIDDRTDFTDKQKEHFVHVDSMWGLTNEHVNNAIKILE